MIKLKTPTQISFSRAQMPEALAKKHQQALFWVYSSDVDHFQSLDSKTFLASWTPILNSKSDIVYLDKNK